MLMSFQTISSINCDIRYKMGQLTAEQQIFKTVMANLNLNIVNRGDGLEIISITINLTILFLFRFMQKCGLSSSRAYCIFAQPANSNGFVLLPIHDFNNRTF